MGFRKLTALLLTLLPLYARGHNYEVYYQTNSRYKGEACWHSCNNERSFSGKFEKKVLGIIKKYKAFQLLSKDNLFIIVVDGKADTLIVPEGYSDILRVLENRFEAIEEGLKYQKSEHKIITKEGPVDIETVYRSDNGISGLLRVKPKSGYLVKDLELKILSIPTCFSTGGYYVPRDATFIHANKDGEVEMTELFYSGYTPLNEECEPIIKFDRPNSE